MSTAPWRRRTPEASTFGTLALLLEDDAGYRASKRFEQDRQYWVDCLAGLPEPASLSGRPWLASRGFIRHVSSLPLRIRAIERDRRSYRSEPAATHHRSGSHLRAPDVGCAGCVLDVPLTARMTPLARRYRACWRTTAGATGRTSEHTVAELIAETTRRMRQVFRHQRYDMTNLRRDLGRVDSDRRVFGPTVNFMPFDYDLRFGGHPSIAHNLTNGPVEDLSIVVYDRLDRRGIRTHFNANPALYSPDKLADLHQRFLGLLTAITDPDQQIGSLDILSARSGAPSLWSGTHRACDRAGTLVSCSRRRWRAVRGGGGGVRGSRSELPRARCPLQPAGASPARARGRPRGGGRAVPGALAGDDRRAARHPQGRRRLSAARSRLPGGAARVHAGGCRGGGAGHAGGAAGAAARARRRNRAARCRLARHRAPSRHAPDLTLDPPISPTSSTRRARPGRQRGSRSPTTTWCGSSPARTMSS